MAKYHYQSQVIGIDYAGIHRLRSGLAVKTIPWAEITSAKVRKGMDYNNWFVMLLLGAGLSVVGAFMIFNTMVLNDSELIDINYFLQGNFLAIVSLGLGILLIGLSMRRTMVLDVEAGVFRNTYSLREIAKQDQIHGLAAYVRSHLRSQVPFSFEP